MSTIEVDGKKYTVTETFSTVQMGLPAKMVKDETVKPFGERVAVKQSGKWRWWTGMDRLIGAPLQKEAEDG